MTATANPFCISSFLAFRYVAKREEMWAPGYGPAYPAIAPGQQTTVSSAVEILRFLERRVADIADESTGLLLSGGIDSAIIAALLPAGTRVYTIRFVAEGAIDEVDQAAVYARHNDLDHRVVSVTWSDYLAHLEHLMRYKRAPLHAIELGLFKAAGTAVSDGINTLVVGNGADSTFGGMDKLLSKDWTFDEFLARYTFVNPAQVLIDWVPMNSVFEPYRRGNGFDVHGFLKVVHGRGIVQTFENAIRCADCQIVAPFEELVLGAPLDVARIRGGDTKYLLRDVFRELYGGMEVPEKIPFARPMDQWLADWTGPSRGEFRSDLDIGSFTGDQKWLIFCLERFLNILDAELAS